MPGSDLLSDAEWRQVVGVKLGSPHFEVLDWTIKPLGSGSGFMGDHQRAEVRVRHLGETRTLNFFCKASPEALEGQKDLAAQTGIFTKEVYVLDRLFPDLRSVLKEDLAWTCQCYYTRPDLIVLEDLISDGFKVIHSREETCYEHYALVLKAVANMHSASLIFEESQDKPFDMYQAYKTIFETDFFHVRPNHPGETWLKTSIDGTLRTVELVVGEKKFLETKDRLKKFLSTMYGMQVPSQRFRNVVTHGDLWRNNIMFKEEDGRPIAAHPLDFQLCRYAPPAHDIMCFLYLTSDRAFRDQHARDLIAGYYDQVSANLKAHGLDPDKVLPWEEVEQSCEEYRKLGLITTSFYSHAILIKEEIFKDAFKSSDELMRFLMHDRKKEIDFSFESDPLYVTKITSMVEELVEMCLKNA